MIINIKLTDIIMIRPPIDIVLREYKVRYTGVYTENYSSIGKLYCFIMRVKNNKKDIALRVTSKDKNFKSLYSVDILNNKMEPTKGLEITNDKGKSSADIVEKIVKGLMDPTELKKNPKMLHEDADGGAYDKGAAIGAIIQALVGLLSMFFMFNYISTKIKNWFQEKHASSAENDLNKKLFEGQNGKEPEFECYNKLINSIELIINNSRVKSLIICGIPGTSKTYIVRRTLYFNKLKNGKEYVLMKGTTLGLYDFCSILYKNRDKIVILDDFDKPLEDPGLVNILKSATDSYDRRMISVPRVAQRSRDGGDDIDLPEKFEFSGKLVIITNYPFSKLDKALVSRSLTIEINFKPEEFVENIQKMLKYIMPDVDMSIKEEVLEYVSLLIRKHQINGLNFRTFQNAIVIRMLYDNWKDMIKYALK